jgi:hypothetical protein
MDPQTNMNTLSIFHMQFRDQLIAYTKTICRKFSNEFGVSYDDILASVIDAKVDAQPEAIAANISSDPKTCNAFVTKNGVQVRCSRGQTTGKFCKTHAKMHAAGKVHNATTSNNDNNMEEGSEKEPSNKKLEMIVVDKTHFLYDYSTRDVYSFENVPKLIGKMDEHNLTIGLK